MQDLSSENIQALHPLKLTAAYGAEQSTYLLLCSEKTSAEERIQSSIQAESLVTGESHMCGKPVTSGNRRQDSSLSADLHQRNRFTHCH